MLKLTQAFKPSLMKQSQLLIQPQFRGVFNQEEKAEEKQNKAFVDDINYFLSKEQFNFYDFHERVLVSCFLL